LLLCYFTYENDEGAKSGYGGMLEVEAKDNGPEWNGIWRERRFVANLLFYIFGSFHSSTSSSFD